jgi:molecular chaperone GrpE (heat shock protein)
MSKNKFRNSHDIKGQTQFKSQSTDDSMFKSSSAIEPNNDYKEDSQVNDTKDINYSQSANQSENNQDDIPTDIDQNQSNQDQSNLDLELIIAQLQSSQIESKDWQNKAFRYSADLENTRKQHDLDLAQSRKNTKKNLVNPILDFLNNQYLVLSFFDTQDNEQIQKSISTLRISFAKLITDLQLQGIDIIIPVSGDEFNPQIMQALNSPEDVQDAKIQNVVSLGLRVDNQLIQPVMVMI